MPLVVNADDFGISESVNRAIKECFEKKYIDRTTVMANMPFAEEAAQIARENGFNDKVGLHVNLTQGKPLTEDIAKNPLFCDENGEFTAAFYRNTLLRLRMDKKSMEDMYTEIKAQLDEYVRLGFTLNHIDSHHHVHTNYPVYKVLKRLSADYSFSSVRLSRNLYTGGSFPVNKYKEIYNRKIAGICDSVTDYFGSYKDALAYYEGLGGQINPATVTSEEAGGRVAEFITKYSTEIMVHPMYSDGGVLSDTEISFENEVALYDKLRNTYK